MKTDKHYGSRYPENHICVASSSAKEKMIWEKEQSIMKIRYLYPHQASIWILTRFVHHRDANGLSAKRIAQEWGYEEENTELQNDGSQTWEEDSN